MGKAARLCVNISASFLPRCGRRSDRRPRRREDVTSLRRLHEQIVRSERLAAGGSARAGVAHEVGNPLTASRRLLRCLWPARPIIRSR